MWKNALFRQIDVKCVLFFYKLSAIYWYMYFHQKELVTEFSLFFEFWILRKIFWINGDVLFNVSVTDTRIQEEESLDLSKEIFALLNNCNPENSSVSLVMTTIVQWLQSSPRSILLMPCVRVASRCLASHTHIVNIVEECIHVYFKGGMKTQKHFIYWYLF